MRGRMGAREGRDRCQCGSQVGLSGPAGRAARRPPTGAIEHCNSLGGPRRMRLTCASWRLDYSRRSLGPGRKAPASRRGKYFQTLSVSRR